MMTKDAIFSHYSLTAVCPFYKNNGRQSISCEGFLPNAKAGQVFATEEETRAHLTRLCGSYSYHRCPHAAALLQKYAGQTPGRPAAQIKKAA